MKPIRLALVGAGIFARDAHVPSLLTLNQQFTIAAIYSRSEASARALADLVDAAKQETAQPAGTTAATAIYTDLAALLANPDIDAVDVVLPIPVMPPVVAQVLASGKHLISEKPLAADVATGRQLLAHHNDPQQVWMVAENWRYEAAFVQATKLVQEGAIGQPISCHMALFLPLSEGSKYFGTMWRRSTDFFGGALMDGGVHHVALMRMLLGEVAEVSAHTARTSPHFEADETMSASLRFANGALGTYLVTYGWGAPWGGEFHVVGERGALRVQRGIIELTVEGETEKIPCQKFDGVAQEFAAFAAAVQTGAAHLNSPEEALRDVAVVEAMIRSAETRQYVRPDQL